MREMLRSDKQCYELRLKIAKPNRHSHVRNHYSEVVCFISCKSKNSVRQINEELDFVWTFELDRQTVKGTKEVKVSFSIVNRILVENAQESVYQRPTIQLKYHICTGHRTSAGKEGMLDIIKGIDSRGVTRRVG